MVILKEYIWQQRFIIQMNFSTILFLPTNFIFRKYEWIVSFVIFDTFNI